MNWDTKTVIAAIGLLKMYTNFLFIVSFIVTMNATAIIKPISIKLQRRSSDIVNAYHEVAGVVRELSELRASDRMLHDWYNSAEAVAADVDVVPAVPRTTTQQCHRDRREYYRKTIILPLLDQPIEQMRERFGNTQVLASRLLHLIPSLVCIYNRCVF